MSLQTIFRNASPGKPFVILPRELAQDDNLTPEEGWLLIYMLSQPTNWAFNVKNVMEARKMGRDRVYKAIKGLVQKLYSRRVETRDKAGRVMGYEYHFTDTPGTFSAPVPENQEAGALPVPEKPDTGVPVPENQDAYKGKKLQRKETTKKKRAGEPASAADEFPILEDWSLPESFRSWATKESPEHAGMIEAEAKKFKRFWREKAANGSDAEWLRRWQSWFERTIARPPAVAAKVERHWSDPNWGGVTVRNTDETVAEMVARCTREGTYKPPRAPA